MRLSADIVKKLVLPPEASLISSSDSIRHPTPPSNAPTPPGMPPSCGRLSRYASSSCMDFFTPFQR